MSALAETEKENCLKLKKTIEGFTADMTEARLLQKNYCTILAEKDRMIQKMTLLLDNKDSVINQLTEKNQNLMKHEIKDMEKCMYELKDALQQKENEIKNLAEKKGHDATQYETLLSQQAQNLHKSGMEVQALQEKLQESKDIIKTLQESQHQLTSNLNNAEELTHNQECLLQSLRDSLQSRDNEVIELYQIIDEHNATIAKLQDMLLKSQNEQLQTFQVMPTQLQFLELQNTLFCTQIELQKKQMALRQKERQLTDVKRSQKLLEVDLLEGQQQKETTWKHNQELHGALHKLQRELQEKIQHLKNLEEEKCTKLLAQEHSIERLKQTVSQKEQILQEYIDVLHYQPSLERVQGGNEHMIQKLQQRIKERDAALEKAVDDKFCALEEKDKEIQRLKMIIREREHDLERLSNVLSGNEETINSLDSLVKAKDMELDQISAACKNLQWLKQKTEEKYRCSLNERESIIQQLQKNLQERNKEMEEIRTHFHGKFDICSGHMIEELKMCLQRKEKMLQDAVFARNQQAEEHMKEVMDLLAMVSSEKMDQTSSCQNCLLKEHNTGVNQYVENLSNFIHLQKLVQEKEKIIQTLTQSCSVQPMVISMKSEDLDAKGEETENNKALKTDLAKAKEDLRLVLRKMREYQLEVSALQSIIMKQNEQLHEQATDIDTLTRKNQMKEELIKDLQVKLADPEEIPTVELLTQQIFILKENIATLNLASHCHLTHTQKIFKFLEELATNKSRLNEALQAEKQLYSCLVQFHTETDSSSSALHNELLAVQTLRGQLEDTLMRTMEQLVTLQSESKVPACFGGVCDNNNSADKKINKFHEPKEVGSYEIMMGDVQKLKNGLQHLINKKKRVKEELHVCKSELESGLKFQTLDLRYVKHDLSQKKISLNVEKARGALEQWKDKNEKEKNVDMTKENRKQNAQINVDDKNQNSVGQLEKNLTLNSNPITSNTKEKEHVGTVITGRSKETSLKRSLNGSSPEYEGELQIHKKTAPGEIYLFDDNCPVSSCFSEHRKCFQQFLLETQNTQLQDTSTSLNGKHSESQLDGLVKYDTKKNHMEFQDLGYETCGKSENEIDREETTSPECEEDGDLFNEINHMIQKDCDDQYCSPMTSMTPAKSKGFWHTDQKSDVSVPKPHVKKLKSHLQTSKKLLQQLQSQRCLCSKCHGFTEEDEGWQSDTAGRNSYTVLEQLAKRVSKLESYIYYFRKDAGIQCSLKSVTIPGKYDWLIQAQARELSLLRQKVGEGQSMCNILTQHLDEGLKSFEEMLRANDIDYFMGQSFRQQLFQVNQLAKKLDSKLNSKGFSLTLNENMEDELLANRPDMKIMQKDDLMETFQSTCENRFFAQSSSHDSLESDGSSMTEDQLSASDELDGCSELSATSGCFYYEPDSTQDTDFCNSVFFKTASDSRNGLYIFCHSEDFGTLKKNILNGKTLLYNIETHVHSLLHIPYVEVHGGKVKDCGNVSTLFSAIRTMDNILEESNSILSLFWNANQPTKQVNNQQKREEQVMRDEICTLKNKLKEQEMLLQKASDNVKNANFAREGMEKLIMKQLTATCGVLKKARLNLLVKSNNIVQPSVQLT